MPLCGIAVPIDRTHKAEKHGEGHSCISLRELTSMGGSCLIQHYTTFPLLLQIPWPLDAEVQRHSLLALIRDISEGPFKFQSSLWLIKINFSLCPILLLSRPLIYCWQEHSSINFLHPSLHLRIGSPGNPSPLFSCLILSHYYFFSFPSFPLRIEWSYIPVFWGQSYFTPANLVTHLVSTLFNSQRVLI